MCKTVKQFRDLHHKGSLLLLPNAWDAASARLFEGVGAKAIATTSAGVAWSLGYPDGSAMPFYEAIGQAGRIARVLDVPLSVDIEDGYSDSPHVVAQSVVRLAMLGIAGINIEDGMGSAVLLAAKIKAIREALVKAGADIFINARTDVFLAQLDEPPFLLTEAIARAQIYAAAGADGYFVPGISGEKEIRALVDSTNLPLNVMEWPGLPDAAALARLGVQRFSTGSGIAQIVWNSAQEHAGAFLDSEPIRPTNALIPYSKMQDIFSSKLQKQSLSLHRYAEHVPVQPAS